MLAAADGQVWLRLWAQVLALAFLTGRPLPHVPAALRRTWPSFDVRTRECLLATVVQAAVASRALALRHTYDPRRLEAAVATTAAGLLAAAVPSPAPAAKAEDVGGATTPSEGDGWRNDALRFGTSRYLAARVPLRAGQVWVIPQLRWLHEADRLDPLGPRQVSLEDIAPPLDFELAGLPDWPGIRVGDRLDGLRRHRLSMDSERNRGIARAVLVGADGDGADGAHRAAHTGHGDRDLDRDGLIATGFEADLAIAGIGLGHAERLRYVQRMLGIVQRGAEPGWLEVVSSWRRFLGGEDHTPQTVSSWERSPRTVLSRGSAPPDPPATRLAVTHPPGREDLKALSRAPRSSLHSPPGATVVTGL